MNSRETTARNASCAASCILLCATGTQSASAPARQQPIAPIQEGIIFLMTDPQVTCFPSVNLSSFTRRLRPSEMPRGRLIPDPAEGSRCSFAAAKQREPLFGMLPEFTQSHRSRASRRLLVELPIDNASAAALATPRRELWLSAFPARLPVVSLPVGVGVVRVYVTEQWVGVCTRLRLR